MKLAHQLSPYPIDSIDVATKQYADDVGGGGGSVVSGTGSPEGAVAANVGTIYQQTDGTTDTAVWIKETGTGDTGWTAIALSDVCRGSGIVKTGTGSPEGAVTGNVGEIFERTDGGTGTTLYIKESGTGNTGWVAVAVPPAVNVISGSGSPEGAVSAPVSTIYQRTDGGTDTAVYIKEAGTGNTGWVAFALSDVVRTADITNMAETNVRNTWTKSQVVSPSTLTYGANISVDASLSDVFEVTLTGATAQLDNPTNLIDGQTIIFRIKQDGVGGRALTFDTNYDFGLEGTPDFTSTSGGDMDIVTCIVVGTKLFCQTSYGFTP